MLEDAGGGRSNQLVDVGRGIRVDPPEQPLEGRIVAPADGRRSRARRGDGRAEPPQLPPERGRIVQERDQDGRNRAGPFQSPRKRPSAK